MNSTNHFPPRAAQSFLNWFLRSDLAEEVHGDLEEQFYSRFLITSGPLPSASPPQHC